mmetsp:Transcript_27500/g.98163  ORF Transcript_27500/g.98163 Transcript_27500/m.98163 type:complete len:128 (+) Transcript_27500:761-1144(+)
MDGLENLSDQRADAADWAGPIPPGQFKTDSHVLDAIIFLLDDVAATRFTGKTMPKLPLKLRLYQRRDLAEDNHESRRRSSKRRVVVPGEPDRYKPTSKKKKKGPPRINLSPRTPSRSGAPPLATGRP